MAFENRFRPLVARRAMKKLREDPDDTAQAIVVIGALSGNSGKRAFKRFSRSPGGQQILREKRDLLSLMSDVERLKSMPANSLGAAIADWYELEDLSAQGLADASEAAFSEGGPRRAVLSSDEDLFSKRLLDLHDVFHVLTGYGRDLLGESAVLSFTIPQTRNPGIAYLVLDSLRETGWNSDEGKLIREAYRRGRRCEWLVDRDWEALFELPIDEVRAKLGVGPPPVYEQMRSDGAPVLTASA
jgi:ubiquinone biosynthesis protein COQ4